MNARSISILLISLIVFHCAQATESCNCIQWNPTKVAYGCQTTNVNNHGMISGVIAPQTVTITPQLICAPVCQPSYQWSFSGPTSGSGVGVPFQIAPTQPGMYSVMVLGKCDTILCDTLLFTIIVNKSEIDSCYCVRCDSAKVAYGSIIKYVNDNGTVTCGIAPQTITITPQFICGPGCQPSYQWSFSGPTSGSGTGAPFQIVSAKAGCYSVIVIGQCGEQKCDTIHFSIIVINVPIRPCNCGKLFVATVTFGSVSQTVGNNKTVKVPIAQQTITISPILNCMSSEHQCRANFKWAYQGPSVGSGSSVPIRIQSAKAGIYTVTINGKCGSNNCGKITIYIKVASIKVPLEKK